ncbi:MAG: histidine phosphatase family protein [Candidatus Obscuribacterales bacterium]|nr:histidine phosphatase family protein [Steroidobacteraceae bacterium]
MAIIFLTRHAQASFGTDDYDRLSPLGHKQAEIAGEYFHANAGVIDVIYSGTARRHLETAQGIAKTVRTSSGGVPEIRIDPRLNEVDAEAQFIHLVPVLKERDAEIARLAEEAKQSSRSYQKVLSRVFTHWQDLPANYAHLESWPHFAERVYSAIKDIARNAGNGANTVVVSSGGSIATITQHVLGLPKTSAYPLFEALINCSVTRLLHTRERISLSSFNDHSYLHSLGKMRGGENMVTFR